MIALASAQYTISDVSDSMLTQATEPVNPAVGLIWVDTSVSPSEIKRYVGGTSGDDGSGWVVVGYGKDAYDGLVDQISDILEDLRNIKEVLIPAKVDTSDFNLLKARASTAEANITNLTSSLSSQSSSLISLTSRVSTLEDKTKYVKSIVDPTGSPGIDIGPSTGPLIGRITQNRLVFLNGTTELAYYDNTGESTGQARVTGKMSIGQTTGTSYDFIQLSSGLAIQVKS